MSIKITQQCNSVLPLMLRHTVCSLRADYCMLGLVSEAGAACKSTADVRVRARDGWRGLMKTQ